MKNINSETLIVGSGIAGLYAAIKLTEKGFDVYQSFIDDHGVDLIAIKGKKVYYVQVKTVRIGTYSFIRKNQSQ